MAEVAVYVVCTNGRREDSLWFASLIGAHSATNTNPTEK